VSTPRRTRLLRTPDLGAFQRAIEATVYGWGRASALPGDVPARPAGLPHIGDVRACAVIVPSRAAGAELRRTVENRFLGGAAAGARPAALALPDLLTRDDWYAAMHARLPDAPSLLGPLEREVIARAAAREAIDAGSEPPFNLRPGLIVEILALYDALARQRRTLDAFERLMVDSLEPSADLDRGAARMLRQTRFLVAMFRNYQTRVAASGALDEHALRERLLDSASPAPYRHVVVTVADRAAEPEGLWPADFDLLTRLAGLEEIDIVATEAALAAGLHERLHDWLPGIEEERVPATTAAPVLLVPEDAGGRLYWSSRDREEELVGFAARLKGERAGGGGAAPPLDRSAVVFKRPLPYVYLARTIFERAAVPYQTSDALPLAAEPYAAVLHLVFTAVVGGFTRRSLVGLLRSPHLVFTADSQPVGRRAIAALDRRLREIGYAGDLQQLVQLTGEAERDGRAGRGHPAMDARLAAPAARAAVALVRELQVFTEAREASAHLADLFRFITAHENLSARSETDHERHLRARSAVLGALKALGAAHLQHDDPVIPFADLASSIRRWIEDQTFAPQRGTGGVHLVDAQAARYGDYDEITIVGVVEGDWPGGSPRNIFYPPSLLTELGWPPETARLSAARAAFHDLLRLSRARATVSTFTLEDDGIVEPSVLLEDLSGSGLSTVVQADVRPARVLLDDALSEEPVRVDVLCGAPERWAALRQTRSPATDARYHGAAGPPAPRPHPVRAVEQYLECPFKFFAAQVLRLEEEPEDEQPMTPKEQGRLVHEVFERFYDEWQREGHGAVTPGNLPEARALFARMVEGALASLGAVEAALQRTRLLGSPTAPGLGELVLRVEAERPATVLGRLLEVRLAGEFELTTGDRRRVVALSGKADRIDLLEGRRLRVIDYKLGRAPNPRRTIQLPIYAVCAEQHLERTRSERWELDEALYLALGEADPVVPLVRDSAHAADALSDAQARFLDAVDGIERGDFSPRPAEAFQCTHCAYATVCRRGDGDGE